MRGSVYSLLKPRYKINDINKKVDSHSTMYLLKQKYLHGH